MRRIVTDKVARREWNLRAMFDIEMPCCGSAAQVEELTDWIGCETCGVVLELGDDTPTGALPLAA